MLRIFFPGCSEIFQDVIRSYNPPENTVTCLNPPFSKNYPVGILQIWHNLTQHFWAPFHIYDLLIPRWCVCIYVYIYIYVYMYIYIYIITWFLRKDHKIHHKIHHKIRYDGLYDPDLLILWWIALYQSWWSSYYWSEEPIIIYYYIKNLIYLNIMIIFHDTLW